MKGFRNNGRFLEGKASFCGRGSLKGEFYHLQENYPAQIEGNDKVHVEVYELHNSETCERFDWLEGYSEVREGNLYDRVIRIVSMEDGRQLERWVYLYNDAEYARTEGIHIPDGDWRACMEKEMS